MALFYATISRDSDSLFRLSCFRIVHICLSVLSLLLFNPWEFFTSAKADGLSLESEWQQVSSSLQDSSQYSGQSQQCCSLDRLHLSSYSKSSSPFTIHLVTVPRAPITNDITVSFIFHSFFNSQARSRYLSFLLISLNFTLWSVRTAKSTFLLVLSFLVDYCKVKSFSYN